MIGSTFGHRMRLMLVASLAALAVLAVGAAGAQAKWVKLSGNSEITPSSQAVQFLNDKGVSVAPVGARHRSSGGVFNLPIRAGFGNTKNYQGILVHNGGLQFTKGKRSFVVRGFVVVRTKPSGAVLLAKIPALRGGCANIRQRRPPVPGEPPRVPQQGQAPREALTRRRRARCSRPLATTATTGA